MENWEEKLIIEAGKAREMAYVPYSGFSVGAALLTKEGKIYKGCNIENASYGATNCAERTAIFKAVSEGEREFKAIAIVGGKKNEKAGYAFPCGMCRQVMTEFCKEDFLVLIAKDEKEYQKFMLPQLMPNGFGGENLT